MTARVYVTRAQVAAARAMVARSLITGRRVSDSVRKIACATPRPTKPDPEPLLDESDLSREPETNDDDSTDLEETR